MRQDDGAPDARRARGDHRRRDQDRRPRRQRPDTEGSRHRDGLSELRALPAHDRRAEPRLRTEAAEDAQERGARARPPRCESPADRGFPQTEAARALGRPAPARRDGPSDRPRATGVPDGRAAVESRRETARPDAGGDPPAPAPPGRDDDLRDPRPGGGDDDGRSRRRHERRASAPGRHTSGALRQARERVRRRIHRLAVDQLGRNRSGLSQYVGHTIMLGIRPEDFEDASIESDVPPDRRVKVTADLIEPLGSEMLVYFSSDAPAVVSSAATADSGADAEVTLGGDEDGTGRSRLVARVDPRSRIATGSEIELAVDTSRLYFFDKETGEAV